MPQPYEIHSFAFVASALVLVLMYALVITEIVNRAVIAVLGAGLLIGLGVLTQADALHAVDFNTIGLLVGMMIMVAVAPGRVSALRRPVLSPRRRAGSSSGESRRRGR